MARTKPSHDRADATGKDCSYAQGAWRCRGTGFLWHDNQESEAAGRYPCPDCNTVAFLRQAKKIAEARHPAIAACACCMPAGPSGVEVWLTAVERATNVNPQAARQGLAEIGRVKVFGENAALEIFQYPRQTEPAET